MSTKLAKTVEGLQSFVAGALPRIYSYRIHEDPYRIHEDPYRNSASYKEMAKALDVWSLCITLIANGLHLRWQRRFMGHDALHRIAIDVFNIVSSIAQFSWSRVSPDGYFRHRSQVRVLHRLTRTAQFLWMNPVFYRKIVNDLGSESTMATAMCHLDTPLPLPAAASLAKCILLASGAVMIFIPAVNTPLPFLQQLLFQSAECVVLVTLQLAPALHTLKRLPHSSEALQLCMALNSIAQMMEFAAVGTAFPVARYKQQCAEHAGRMLMLFAVIYMAFLLPLYVSFRLDRYTRDLYVHLERGDRQTRVGVCWMHELLMVCMLGLAAWLVVLCSHAQLASWALPL